MLFFVYNMIHSARHGTIAGDNPWGALTLEWQVSSPPPIFNFDARRASWAARTATASREPSTRSSRRSPPPSTSRRTSESWLTRQEHEHHGPATYTFQPNPFKLDPPPSG